MRLKKTLDSYEAVAYYLVHGNSSTYSDVFDRLERDKVRYVVVSGVAVVLHGYVRPVADLDIVIDRSPDEARHAMMTLMASGFVPTIPLPLNALTVLRMFDGLNREVDRLRPILYPNVAKPNC